MGDSGLYDRLRRLRRDDPAHGVPPLDVLTYATSGLAIMAVGAIAASLPALRAARIDPVGALRAE